MNKLEKFLAKRNFKKIAVWYIVLAVIAGLACAGAVGYIYRERLNFAWQYSKLEDAKDTAALQTAAEQTASASADVVDVLIVDGTNRVTYSAKNSEFADGTFAPIKAGSEKKYLVSSAHPDAVFQYVKSDEFMLNSIINKDFGKIRTDYDDDSAFESSLAEKSIYMLSRVGVHHSDSKVYVITVPTTVSGGATALKISAAVAVLFFCVYWVLIALWMYRDASKCKLSPLCWGLIGLFTNLIGLIVYKIYKRSMAVCTSCGAAQSAGHLYCSFCGAQLGNRCEKCGGKVSAKDSFCHHCGNQIK